MFELKNLKAEVETEGKINNKKGEQDNEEDLEHFMQQVQGDREMRQHINVYKKKELLKKKAEADQMDEDDEDGEYDDEEVRLEELLDDMSLHSDLEDGDDDDEEEEGEEGAPQKEIKLLSPSDAAKVTPAFELSPSSGNDFDASAFDPKKFKFV